MDTCRFESCLPDQTPVLAEASILYAHNGRCRFESCRGYQSPRVDRFNVKYFGWFAGIFLLLSTLFICTVLISGSTSTKQTSGSTSTYWHIGECPDSWHCNNIQKFGGLMTDAPHLAFEATEDLIFLCCGYFLGFGRLHRKHDDELHRQIDRQHGYKH
jgi:hypothetical protein